MQKVKIGNVLSRYGFRARGGRTSAKRVLPARLLRWGAGALNNYHLRRYNHGWTSIWSSSFFYLERSRLLHLISRVLRAARCRVSARKRRVLQRVRARTRAKARARRGEATAVAQLIAMFPRLARDLPTEKLCADESLISTYIIFLAIFCSQIVLELFLVQKIYLLGN